ncbi:MAG: histidinol-phosphate transaminase [Oscillospiraceae bacterium]|nr:histidinol-phosphate transaminase [Oscillospiraceae bacterium]
MSRFFSGRYAALTPYTPGEQPQDQVYTKLNTNESPFPPSQAVLEWASANTRSLNLYSDPEGTELRAALAELLEVKPENLILTNGSDEVLNLAFMAFCDETHPAAFPDITYGFYPVFAALNRIPYVQIPLRADFSIAPEDYCDVSKTIFLANPNAPTGLLLTPEQIEPILRSNPDSVVVVDEAYIDFGGRSCIPLIRKHKNLLVTRTFSKSRSLAGGRLGFGVADAALIRDLNTLRYSTNPYNVNSLTLALGLALVRDEDTVQANCRAIMEVRTETTRALEARGFTVLPSSANFVFAKTPKMEGAALYQALKAKGVLVRHFDSPRIRDFNRITIGTREQMQVLFQALDDILGGTP